MSPVTFGVFAFVEKANAFDVEITDYHWIGR